MRIVIRYFFRALRLILTPVVLLWEKLTTPKGIARTPEAQRHIDAQTAAMALYQFKSCPFCIKVRRELARLSLTIELRDAQHDAQHRAALQQGGGKPQVPCLRLQDEQGSEQWLYESDAIIQLLRSRFDTAA
ncbi:MAG TPA: glutathione S-transferase N-terminal domain-containing protein [Gammaproteobacteria bacterium]